MNSIFDDVRRLVEQTQPFFQALVIGSSPDPRERRYRRQSGPTRMATVMEQTSMQSIDFITERKTQRSASEDEPKFGNKLLRPLPRRSLAPASAPRRVRDAISPASRWSTSSPVEETNGKNVVCNQPNQRISEKKLTEELDTRKP
ncbi:unnamed protein product [Caenorhabditis auriculariae]|uniref:Uncharacterized protein n=1 Tax=Caenorhabditis auriculariae TaxID=2777116 RepID=A0A8S1GQJ7_9PELO|nr:unnamed protein product [Caenorhabditis auriculariae]